MNGIVTLTTDFGTVDGYVGAMKGVILREHPDARVVDITHDVPPQDIIAGAFAVAAAAPWFPPGTVHVAVVDPGVGSARRAIAIAHGGSLYVGPDNGLLTVAALEGEGRVIDRIPPTWPVSATFHGRDLFARVAARLAAGASLDDFSTGPVAPLRLVEDPAPHVVHVDRFGNLVTNLRDPAFTAVEVAGARAPLRRTYTDVPPAGLVAYVGSSGFVEVAIRDGSAAERLGVGRGAPVRAV